MLLVFQIRSFPASWLPANPRSDGEIKSPHIGAILAEIRTMVDQCKTEGLFAPGLDSAQTVRLILLLFSTVVQNTAKLPPESRDSPAMIREMTATFQIVIRGCAREGVEHSRLDITAAA